MKITLLFLLVILSPLLSFNQIIPDTTLLEKPETLDGQTVYAVVNQMPKFQGGDKAMQEFIQKNISNSLRTKDSKVFVSIVIDKYGVIRAPEILRSKNEAQTKEALRIIKLIIILPKFKTVG